MEMKWIVLALAALMYVTVIIFSDKKHWVSLIAGAAVILIGAVSPVHALVTLINWNILGIYIGSLIIAELFLYSRVPNRLADMIIEKLPDTGTAITAILIMTGIISAFVENVATVLVMAPIALSVCKKLRITPIYFMAGLAVMANLQGTATLVGDPPSMIFASYARYGFNDFFIYQGRMSIFFVVQMGMIAGALYFYLYFTKVANIGKQKISVERESIVSFFPTVLLLLMIVALAVCSFFHIEYSGAFVMILGIAGLIWFRFIRKEGLQKTVLMIKNLDWETIGFLIGVFIVIGTVSETGLLEDFALFLRGIIGGNKLLGFAVIILVSVIISGFVDNVPYIIVMLPVAATLAQNLGLKSELYMFALLVGSCMGGNLTPFGASANIAAMGILKKQGAPMSFADWCKIGVPFTLITTAAASILLWFLWG
ncbi:SLC13 family permease [Treponema sp. HNW]|uniref:SLC13 family permease n=1 Tax=Treponema sp. HNW TaxID=3116654 RepID=UPI003D0B6A18